MLPQDFWRKRPWALSLSAAAWATPATANGSSNSAACSNTLPKSPFAERPVYCHPERSEGSAFLPAMREFRGNPRSNDFPRDGLRFPGVQILDAAANLLIPCCLGSFVDSGVQALDDRASQFGALFFGQGESLLKQLGSLLRHGIIIPLRPAQNLMAGA